MKRGLHMRLYQSVITYLVVLLLGWVESPVAFSQTRTGNAAAGAAATVAPGGGPVAIPAGGSYELIGTYSIERLNRIVGEELDEFMKSSTMPTDFRGRFEPARYAVKLYRVRYRSVIPEQENRPVLASGLVAIPETGKNRMPLVSYQHGTVFDRSDVPSNPDRSMETRLMVSRFAGQGYIVIAADYFGRGYSSVSDDSYLVRDSTRQAGRDLFLNVQDFLTAGGISVSHFFLSGWSQGGWVTMNYLHALESLGLPVTAAAAASAPVDISLIMNRWINNPQPVDAPYLPGVVAIQLGAYEKYLRSSGLIEAAIRPQYVQPVRDLYDGKIDWTEFFKRTTPRLVDMVRPEFALDGFTARSRYWRELDSLQAYRWRIISSLRVYYGGSDEVTPAYIGLLPEQTQKLVGGRFTSSHYAGDRADHRAVFVFSVIDQKRWFDGFLKD
jgi:pimeloyl-ACP methyl ester carboxylesterase